MKIKFLGINDQTEITLRGVTFAKGKPVEVADGDFQDRLVRLDYFAVAKPRKAKNDKDSA